MSNAATGHRSILVLGGTRSGKSALAEDLVEKSGLDKVYIATGTAGDAEMSKRIAAHRARRGPDWRTVEEPLELAACLEREAAPGRAILVDCLTLWLTNAMMAERDLDSARDTLAAAMRSLPGLVVMVSSEVGSGIVPMNAMARRFADEAGLLHQAIAAGADEVYLAIAGLPHRLKPPAAPCTF